MRRAWFVEVRPLPASSRYRLTVADIDDQGAVIDAAAVVDCRDVPAFMLADVLTDDVATRYNVARAIHAGEVREIPGPVCP